MPIEIFHSFVAVLFLAIWGVIGAMSTPQSTGEYVAGNLTQATNLNATPLDSNEI